MIDFYVNKTDHQSILCSQIVTYFLSKLPFEEEKNEITKNMLKLPLNNFLIWICSAGPKTCYIIKKLDGVGPVDKRPSTA